MLLTLCAAAALIAWLAVLLAPWQPHRTRERLEAEEAPSRDLSDVSVLIPARDEAAVIARTLAALRLQGDGLDVIVVDDQSTDATREICAAFAADESTALAVSVVAGGPLPSGWAGKTWALEQGLAHVGRPSRCCSTPTSSSARGPVPALRRRAEDRGAALVSVLAELHCESWVERLLTPSFVFFFKLLYPFALANDARRRTAAAAGGCMLVRTARLRSLGGFASIRGALIDDCSLAAALKRAGKTTWLGLSHSVAACVPMGSAISGGWWPAARSRSSAIQRCCCSP